MAGDASDAPSGAVVGVPLAIALGLLASFVQSLGLTIQRKSHLIAARQPIESRPAEWRQPLWLVGFAIFIVANIGGTIFQIGALPIVMLAPLGAVSLLYNALLAKFLLEDALGSTMVGGTALILVGAVLIGYFGAIQEPPHSLDELLSLFGRPPFIALSTILFMAFACILVIAHLAEWQLLLHLNAPPPSPTIRASKNHRGKKHYARLTRRWSAPTLAPLDEVSETTSGVATPVLAVRDQERLQQTRDESLVQTLASKRQGANGGASRPGANSRKDYGSRNEHEQRSSRRGSPRKRAIAVPEIDKESTDAVKKTKLLLAVGFAAVSGTLSGLCLLLAKSGVELLVLTFALGRNQFNRIGSWALVGVMLLAAVAQLWYLNKSLRMADPTLVCPLAFCFYNTSSIALGLVYFNQLSSISSLSLCLIVVGIVILLAGVIIVSSKPPSAAEAEAAVSEGSSLDRLLSPVNDHILSPTSADATESEALLANAGGIAGPHLPPPNFTLTMPPASESQARPAALSDSPPALGSPIASPTSPERSRRSSSLSKPGSASASHHHHVVGLGLQPAFHYVEGSSDPQPLSPSKPTSGSAIQRGLPGSPRTPSTVMSPTTGGARERRRRSSAHMYSTILSRGLSIGLSPASPGFHIGPFSPADEEEEEAEARAEAEAERRRVLAGDLEGQGGRGARGRGRGKALAQRMDRRTLSEGFLDGMRGSVPPDAPDATGSGSALDVSSPEPPTEGPSTFPSTPSTSQQTQTQQTQPKDGRTLAPPAEPSAAPSSASTSAFRLFLPSVALDSTTLSERLSRLNPLGPTSSSSTAPAPGGAGAGAEGRAGSPAGSGMPTGGFVRGGGGRGAYWPSSLTGGVREWWSQNVNGREGFREGERRRLLDG